MSVQCVGGVYPIWTTVLGYYRCSLKILLSCSDDALQGSMLYPEGIRSLDVSKGNRMKAQYWTLDTSMQDPEYKLTAVLELKGDIVEARGSRGFMENWKSGVSIYAEYDGRERIPYTPADGRLFIEAYCSQRSSYSYAIIVPDDNNDEPVGVEEDSGVESQGMRFRESN